LSGGIDVGSATEGFGYDVGGFEADGELMAEASTYAAGEEWRERRNVGDSAEIEIALAVLGSVFEFLMAAVRQRRWRASGRRRLLR